jgi:hypothetical protein
MSLKIKEISLRWEDDGHESGLAKEEYIKTYSPLNLSIHHHCAPANPKNKKDYKFEYDETKEKEKFSETVIRDIETSN